MSNKRMVMSYVAQKVRREFPCKAWVEMPLGAKPFAVQISDQGFVVLAVVDPEAPILDHPLLLILVSPTPTEIPLGEDTESVIGPINLSGEHAVVCRGTPWPTSLANYKARLVFDA